MIGTDILSPSRFPPLGLQGGCFELDISMIKGHPVFVCIVHHLELGGVCSLLIGALVELLPMQCNLIRGLNEPLAVKNLDGTLLKKSERDIG